MGHNDEKHPQDGGGLMTGKMLSKVGASLVRRFGTRDPFQIAKGDGNDTEQHVSYLAIFSALRNINGHTIKNAYSGLNTEPVKNSDNGVKR